LITIERPIVACSVAGPANEVDGLAWRISGFQRADMSAHFFLDEVAAAEPTSGSYTLHRPFGRKD
jgi:hypothetical protein